MENENHKRPGSELQNHQTELESTEERYRALFDVAPVGYFVFDSNGRVVRANGNAAALLGVGQSKLIGRPFVVFLVPEHHTRFFTYLASVFESKKEQLQKRFRLVARDRKEHWVTFQSRFDGTDKELPVCYAAAFDSTEEIQTRRRMEESEQRYRLIVESINDAVYLSEIDRSGRPGRFVAVNGQAVRTLGYAEEELLTLNAMQINAPESRQRIPEIAQDLRKNGRGVYELSHQRKDGSCFPVEVSARIVVLDGETRILSVARDITERTEAQRRISHLREVLRTITHADRVLLREEDPHRIITETAQVLVNSGGYGKVWITLRGEDGSVIDAAQAGIGNEYQEFRELLSTGWLPACVHDANAEPEPIHVVTDRDTVCSSCPLRNSYGDGLPAAVTLHNDGHRIGHMVATLQDDSETKPQQVQLLGEFADNLGHALSRHT